MGRRTTKQRIHAYRDRHPDATIRDIQRALNLSSPSVVHFHLNHVGKGKTALLAVADELERLVPIPGTFRRMTPEGAARATLRMAAQLVRDRANGDTSRDRQATPEELREAMTNGK